MLIGHLGVGLIGKKMDSRIPIWLLLVAAVFVDLINCLFLFIGLETVRVSPGFTRWVPIEIVSIPYSHSLLFEFLWALVMFGAVVLYARKRQIQNGVKAGLVLAVLVVTHYVCDVLVHVHDMALWPGSVKLGLGLWNFPLISNTIEIGLFCGGLLLCASVLRYDTFRAKVYLGVYAAINIALQLVSGFIPPFTTSVIVLSSNLLLTFIILIALGWILDRKLERA
ncbi:MAG: hypothetical protein K8S54_20425 [Spirochaetia bacterium]|nr:hypothetical protein [Spirochaetia bacterium]